MTPLSPEGTARAASERGRSRRRRRPTNPDEQQRRHEWGVKWGAIMADYARTHFRKGR